MHVIVPIKRYADAKIRLSPALSAQSRARLAGVLAENLLLELALSCVAARVVVVTGEPTLLAFCRPLGFDVLHETQPFHGLNGAVEHGLAAVSSTGADHVAVVHADLPGFRAEVFDAVARAHLDAPAPRCTIVTDMHGDGTNLRFSHVRDGLPALYGPKSAPRHAAAAQAAGLEARIIRHPSLSHDCDTPDDLRRVCLPIPPSVPPFMPEARHDNHLPRGAVFG